MMSPVSENLCDQSLIDLQRGLDRLRSDPGVALADHIVMESSADGRATAWAIPANAVTETLVCPLTTRVGTMPSCFRGIAATRARLVTVVDAIHLITGQPAGNDVQGWLTLTDPSLSGGHGVGLWWPHFRGISPVGSLPVLPTAHAPPLANQNMIQDWRIQSDADHDQVMGRVNVTALVEKIMTGPWWEGAHG